MMKSLFWRIFLLSWVAMTLVGGGFSLLVAANYPTDRMERRMQRMVASSGLQGEDLLRLWRRTNQAEAQAALQAMAADAEDDLWLFEGDVVRMSSDSDGDPIEPTADVLALLERATTTGFREQRESGERYAIALRDEAGEPSRWTLAGINHRRSPFERIIEREIQRLLLIVVVAGLLSLALARYLSRPLSQLREASARIAEGDLSVRVTPKLRRPPLEIMALARDFDVMAARVEAMVESQKRLLRDVSHELRSPLARMGVALELARTRAGEDAQPVLDRIERDSLRLGELISEILQLTRLDAGEPDSEVEAMSLDDVADLVSGVAADVDFEAKGQGRAVATEISGLGQGRMSARPELLRRAVENVLRNAVRFTAEGTDVECSVSRNGSSVEIAVRDHGPGVPEDALVEIFRPFFRVESARDRNTGGAGIGLAIVERAVRLHRGTVVAENAEGGGLRIRMRLPLAAT